MIGLYPAVPAWRCSLALLLLELGREEAAAAEFEAVAAAGFGTLPRDANWLIAITLLAEVCARLGDAAPRRGALRRAGALRGPQRARGARRDLQRLGVAPPRRARGGRSATGRARRSTSPPRSAMHEAMGARPFVARTQLAWAEMELARGDAGAARERLAEAIVIADALGMLRGGGAGAVAGRRAEGFELRHRREGTGRRGRLRCVSSSSYRDKTQRPTRRPGARPLRCALSRYAHT